MNPLTKIGISVALSLAIATSFMFTVYETDRSLVLRLGKIKMDAEGKPKVYDPGLNFKLPFIDSVRNFDLRLQTIDIQSSRIVTNEKKDVMVDLFVKYRINDLGTYFVRTGGNRSKAEALLKQKIVDGVRAEFGLRTIKQVVSGERDELMQSILREANASARSLGIDVIDTRVKRIDLPREVSNAVYQRMRTERERIAAEHRARGQSKAEVIRAEADAQVTVMLSTAEQQSKTLRGQGDAEAAHIYASSYNQDPEFYEFMRSLEAYSKTFSEGQDVFVLKPESEFFHFFKKK